MIKNFIFDLDGTLLNTIGSMTKYLNQTLNFYGRGPKSKEECESFLGWGFKGLIQKAFHPEKLSEAKLDEIYNFLSKNYNEDPYDLTKIYDGIDKVLDFLEEKNIPYCIATNKNQDIAQKTVKYFFPKRKVILVKGATKTETKPSSAFGIACMEKMNAKKEETCFVGDSEVDFQTAINSEILPVSVAWGFRTYNELKKINSLVIKTPTDLIKRYNKEKNAFQF